MSTCSLTARIVAGSVVSRTCSLGQPAAPCSAMLCRSTSGASELPPMPSTTASVKPSAFTCRSECHDLGHAGPHLRGDFEPAEAVADGAFASCIAAPERRVAPPDAVGRALGHQRCYALVNARLHTRRARTSRSAGLRAGACSAFSAAIVIDLLERLRERLDALALQFVRHVIDRDAGGCEVAASRRALRRGPRRSCGESTPWSRNASMVAGGIVFTVSGPISSWT